jgi:formylglycine-generating enzyme
VVNNGNSAGKSPWQHTKINERDGAEMVWIPEYTFTMGEWDRSDNPIHTVRLSGYYIYQYPVTVRQYRNFCASTGAKMPGEPSWGWKEYHPIVCVSWYDAVAYCKWAGVRLPTEAEWEHAARGPWNYTYPWGNEFDGSKCLNSVKPHCPHSTAKVGSYPKNDFGLYDMAGNVYNWCQDGYQGDFWTPGELYNNPVNSSSDSYVYRVLRGGAWMINHPMLFQSTFRFGDRPYHGFDIMGFRCASAD